MMATPRKSVSVYSYPEHLNPFHEEDKTKFWTIGKTLKRSNSITFSGIKDLKNSWAFRSFMRKGKKKESTSSKSSSASSTNNATNGEPSPVVFRRAIQYSSSSTLGGPTPAARSSVKADRYVYGGSVTPLPRSRFQERMRSPSQQYEGNNIRRETLDPGMMPRIARSDVTGSRLSVESSNPFDDEECPVPPVRASRRKKKRAPPPPTSANSSLVNSTKLDSSVIEDNEAKRLSDVDIENLNLGIELKIVEDEDTKVNKEAEETEKPEDRVRKNSSDEGVKTTTISQKEETQIKDKPEHDSGYKDKSDDTNFPKVDIVTYRRNSSINENDFQLRRTEQDFIPLATRSKSLSNTTNNNYIITDINLNTSIDNDVDSNSNAKRVLCRYDETARKQSIDTVSSTEKEFIDIDMKTKEIEREISKLNLALSEDEKIFNSPRLSVTEIKKRFDGADVNIPNLVPKPKRSNASGSPINTST